MLDDQEIRRQLISYADGIGVDADADLDRVLDAASARTGRSRRVALLTAVPLLVALVVGAVLLGENVIGRRDADRPATEVTGSRLTGTWMRSVVAQDPVPAEAAGTWTLVLGADGAVTLVPPEAWSLQHSQPNGVYVRSGDAFRTNVFAGESCAGEAGEYSFSVDFASLDLSASVEPCDLRAALLEGRWERGP
jgi:hypothetical protein